MDYLPGDVHNSVLIGLNGCLFLHGGRQQQMAYLTGECEPSEESIRNFFNNMIERKGFCDSRGIKYLHVVFPSKPVIKKNMIPRPLQDKVESLFLKHYSKSMNCDTNDFVLYPHQNLIESGLDGSGFRDLDTHNTDSGYLVVTDTILEKLNANYDVKNFFYEKNVNRSGDLAKMLGLKINEPDQMVAPYLAPVFFENTHTLKGNTHHICIAHNPAAITERRLLIFGDSFMHGALNYLLPAFKDVIYVRSELFHEDMVELCGPDVVISSNAERYLREVSADNTGSSMLFANYGNDDYKPKDEFIKAYKAQFSWRYHREQYEAWRDNVSKSYFEFGDLGMCKLNDQISMIEKESFTFQSSDNDPYFVCMCKKIEPSKKYTLEFEIISDVESTAIVYFTDSNNPTFSNERKVTAPVSIGQNTITFKLDFPNIQSYIRVDPISNIGKFTLSNATLKEIVN